MKKPAATNPGEVDAFNRGSRHMFLKVGDLGCLRHPAGRQNTNRHSRRHRIYRQKAKRELRGICLLRKSEAAAGAPCCHGWAASRGLPLTLLRCCRHTRPMSSRSAAAARCSFGRSAPTPKSSTTETTASSPSSGFSDSTRTSCCVKSPASRTLARNSGMRWPSPA